MKQGGFCAKASCGSVNKNTRKKALTFIRLFFYSRSSLILGAFSCSTSMISLSLNADDLIVYLLPFSEEITSLMPVALFPFLNLLV